MVIQSTRIDGSPCRGGELPGGVAILIPAYNEAAHLPRLIAACRAVKPALILVVDDGSTDGTPELLAREDGAVALRLPENRGKQAAVRLGLQHLASESGVSLVCLIDGDGQHDPAELPGLVQQMLEHDAEVLVGVRTQEQMPVQRRLSNGLVNIGFLVLGGVDLFDVQSGLRVYRKPLADLLGQGLPPEGGYGVEHESLALLAQHAAERGAALRVLGAPVSCRYGEARSKMRPAAMVGLAHQTVRQALRIRQVQGAARRVMTVEIHDVCPATFDEVVELDRALARIGIARPTLLVVPRYEDGAGRVWDLREDPRLARWLRERQAAGAEIVQHGLTHRAPGAPPPGLVNTLMHRWFSRGCDEFAHLPAREACRRLRAGRRILQACGLRAEGFIAPAWQQSPAAIQAVARMGFRFTAFLDRVQPLVPGRLAVDTPALTFAAPNVLVDHGKRAVMRGLEAWARPAPLLRVALHPEDLHGARPADHAIERIRRLLPHREQVTYAEWLDGGAPARLERAA